MPDEGGIRGLFAVSTMHGVVAPRAVGATAQCDTADNDDDLWLCADGCTHHSDHLSISLRAVHQHRPLLTIGFSVIYKAICSAYIYCYDSCQNASLKRS